MEEVRSEDVGFISNALADTVRVYKSAEDFSVDREAVLSNVGDAFSIGSAILPWCSVQLIPGMEVVEVRMEIEKIMSCDNVATALQFSLDDPLVFHLSFGGGGNYTWLSVKDCPIQMQKLETAMEEAVDGMSVSMSVEERTFKNGIKESWRSKMRPHGPRVLLPEIIKEYLEECYSRAGDGRLCVRRKVALSSNIFVNLVIHVGSWLKTLRAFCAICKGPLPPLSRFGCCDKEPCLYKFEELGFGASVLQELRNTELIDLELTLAAAATRRSTRDVFEPFPSFLLKKKEARKRGGFFDKDISDINLRKNYFNTEVNAMDNKNLYLLQKLIDSIPPVSEMQEYTSEIELAVKLGISWLQKDYNANSVNQTDLSEEDYAEKIWLPYKVLRYVLLTNRLSLRLVQDDDRFNLPGSLYQFAVLYDSESELKRAERRKTGGSVFAFHGSALSNWYSIIRNGLKCLSGTNYMSIGRAYGEGIYFSTEMEVSLAYSSSSEWNVHGKRREYFVIALCEIFSGQNYVVAKRRNFLVVPPQNENDIVIRYLLVFNNKNKRCASKKTIITGHILSGDTSLYEHYEKFRFKNCEEVIDGGLAGELLKVARCF